MEVRDKATSHVYIYGPFCRAFFSQIKFMYVIIDYYPTSTAGKWIACFAMMMGVLVIAFPVSVFSELWHQELRKVQGFDLLNEDDEKNDDDVRGERGDTTDSAIRDTVHRSTLPSLGAWEEASLLPDRRGQPTYPPHGPSYGSANDDTVIVMTKNDLHELVGCLDRIQSEQTQLRSILRKYQLDNDSG
jgi:hypothetical protein